MASFYNVLSSQDEFYLPVDQMFQGVPVSDFMVLFRCSDFGFCSSIHGFLGLRILSFLLSMSFDLSYVILSLLQHTKEE